jgi:hypothetical protein
MTERPNDRRTDRNKISSDQVGLSMSTLYASFVDAPAAERAAAALLDHGARAEDISILANNQLPTSTPAADVAEAVESEHTAKTGITTTTAADAGLGAAKGTAVGLGVGILAAVASVFIPGLGLVIGGGALATAVAGAAASAGAGAIAGGIAGYLKDQGMGDDLVASYSNAFAAGNAVLAVGVPSGDLAAEEIEPYLTKYGALNVSTVNQSRNLAEPSNVVEYPTASASVAAPVTPIAPVAPSLTTMTTVPRGPASEEVDVIPNMVNPVTGTMQTGTVVGTGPAVVHREPAVIDPIANEPAMAPVSGFTVRDVTPTESDPLTGQVVRGYVTDPVTGGQRPVRVMNGSIVYLDHPVTGP